MTLRTCIKEIEWNYKIQNWRLSGDWWDSLVIILLIPLRHLAKKVLSLPVSIEISQCIRCSTAQNMYWSSRNLPYVTLGARHLYSISVYLFVLVRTELVRYKSAPLRQHTWCPESWMLHIKDKKKATNKLMKDTVANHTTPFQLIFWVYSSQSLLHPWFITSSLKQTKQTIQTPDGHSVRQCLLEVILKILYSPWCGSHSHNIPYLLGKHVEKRKVSFIAYWLENIRDKHEKINIFIIFEFAYYVQLILLPF